MKLKGIINPSIHGLQVPELIVIDEDERTGWTNSPYFKVSIHGEISEKMIELLKQCAIVVLPDSIPHNGGWKKVVLTMAYDGVGSDHETRLRTALRRIAGALYATIS